MFGIFQDLAWVEQQAFGTPLEKLLMMRIACARVNEASEYNFIQSTRAKLAAYCCTSEGAITDALEELFRRGLLQVVCEGEQHLEIALPYWPNMQPESVDSLASEFGQDARTYLLHCQKNRCWYCGCDLGDCTPHFEHQVPRSRGGPHIANNLVLSCAPCNHSKGPKTVPEFRAYVIERDNLPKAYRFHGERRE